MALLMCRYEGKLVKCYKLIKAETTVVNSNDMDEVNNSLHFIDKHIDEVMRLSPKKYAFCYNCN